MIYLRTEAAAARDRVAFDVQYGVNYHLRRERHFERWGKFFTFVVILFGAATVTDFLGSSFAAWRAVGGVAIAALGALNLVVNFGAEQFRHNELRQRYQDILAELVSISADTDPRLMELQRQILELEKKEPAVLLVTTYLAYNDTLRQAGHEDGARFRVGLLQRAFSGWTDLWPDSIKTPPALEAILSQHGRLAAQ